METILESSLLKLKSSVSSLIIKIEKELYFNDHSNIKEDKTFFINLLSLLKNVKHLLEAAYPISNENYNKLKNAINYFINILIFNRDKETAKRDEESVHYIMLISQVIDSILQEKK